MNHPQNSYNVKLAVCNKTGGAHCSNFNASVSPDDRVVVVAFRNLHEILPQYEKRPLETTILSELTYVGLGISVVSLVLCLIIEFLVWEAVVKSDISNFRHAALVNISLCLLFAHCGFLASSDPKAIPEHWCSILTVAKHFFFLAVFFWMLCLSVVLLHQMIFVFDQLRKKVFLVLSITVGYVCPLICVATTYITFENGKEGKYYSTDTCWLIYQGVLKGSLFSFVIPALTIVMVNLFTLVVVIMKIVTPAVSDSKAQDHKDVAKGMIKTVVFLSPVLGITWLLGVLVLHLDLTQKPFAQIVSYAFTLFNSLQVRVKHQTLYLFIRAFTLKYFLVFHSLKHCFLVNCTIICDILAQRIQIYLDVVILVILWFCF
uniref:G-protein coupled receptors family 2 profile 2 domain-containing protein n=1 Tax=Sinocyclocheilus rhinocerous TaxID=307959 RepID=A0A673L6K3_9TELE